MLSKLFSVLTWSQLILIIMISSSCALSLKKQEVKPIDSYKYSKSSDALTVAVQPMTNPDDCKEYFGLDLISSKILPIFIVVENKNTSSSFTILTEKITMQAENTVNGSTSNPVANELQSTQAIGEVLSGSGTAIGTAAIFMPLPVLAITPVLMIAGGKQISDATVIKHNLMNNELYSKTILPGGSNYGFVYLKIQEDLILTNSISYKLLINASDIEENKQINFEFIISL